MKTFIYYTETTSTRFGRHRVAHIYRIKHNIPKYITKRCWTTASSKDNNSEVMLALADAGKIPKKYKTGYYVRNNNFVLYEI